MSGIIGGAGSKSGVIGASPAGIRAWLSSAVSVNDNATVPLDSITGAQGHVTHGGLSSNMWAVPSSGYYLCCGKVSSGHSGSQRFIVGIYSSALGVLTTERDEALEFEEDNSFSSIVYLAAGDTVYLRNGSGSARTYLSGVGSTEMAVHKLG